MYSRYEVERLYTSSQHRCLRAYLLCPGYASPRMTFHYTPTNRGDHSTFLYLEQ